MAIAEQFAGLQMDQLIGAPLCAAVDASLQLAESTADFIRNAGFDDAGNVRTVAFGYQRFSDNRDGTGSLEEMQVNIPLLAVVPVPNLQVDEVNLLFDIEVKQSERRDSSMELGASASGKLGALKVGITGNISAHLNNIRSTDNSAKYHVDIRAANHGTPEGLARVLDMIAANMTPMLVGSSLRDENGRVLSEQAQTRAEHLQELRARIGQAERRLQAAREGLNISLLQLRKLASAQLNAYREIATRLQGELAETEQDGQTEQQSQVYLNAIENVRQSWESFMDETGQYICLLVDSGRVSEGVSGLFVLKALDEWGNVTDYAAGEVYYEDIRAAQNSALENQRSVNCLEEELLTARAEYNRAKL